MEAIKGKINTKKLIDWLNEKFLEMDIKQYKIIHIHRTRFASKEYEAGACKLVIDFQDVNDNENVSNFLCYHNFLDLHFYLTHGYELYLENDSWHDQRTSISNFILNVRKVT